MLRIINPKIVIDVQLSDGSLKSKLRKASKNKAKYAMIMGEEEIKTSKIILKPLVEENSEQIVMSVDEMSSFVKDIS